MSLTEFIKTTTLAWQRECAKMHEDGECLACCGSGEGYGNDNRDTGDEHVAAA